MIHFYTCKHFLNLNPNVELKKKALATVIVCTKNTKKSLLLPPKRCMLAIVIVCTKCTILVLLAPLPVMCVTFCTFCIWPCSTYEHKITASQFLVAKFLCACPHCSEQDFDPIRVISSGFEPRNPVILWNWGRPRPGMDSARPK